MIRLKKRCLNEDRAHFLQDRVERFRDVFVCYCNPCILGYELEVYLEDDYSETTIEKLEDLGFR